jgi:hypothetical protein
VKIMRVYLLCAIAAATMYRLGFMPAMITAFLVWLLLDVVPGWLNNKAFCKTRLEMVSYLIQFPFFRHLDQGWNMWPILD